MTQSSVFVVFALFALLSVAVADDSFPYSNDTEQRLALLPWDWTVHPIVNSTSTNEPVTCPDAAHTLGMFAAVNGVGALVGLIFSNRHVVRFTTCGRLGAEDSSVKPYTPLFQIAWQVGSTFLNSWLISKVPGYSHVPVSQLALLFLARPRFSWIPLVTIILLDSYHNAAVSTMITEVALQFVGSYTMGLTAHFASTHGYYIVGNHNFPHGNDAYLMYCGAIVFLSFMIMSILSGLLVLAIHGDYKGGLLDTIPNVLIVIVFLLSSLCWIGSWLFWAGFIKLAGDNFCLPNLVQTGTIFALFSVFSSYTATLLSH